MDQQKSRTFSGHGSHRWAYTGLDAPQIKPASTNNHLVNLLRDLIKLVDLQLQMISLDVRQFWQEAKLSVLTIILGAVFALGAIPVLLLGMATTLSEASGLPASWVQMGLAAVIVLLAAGSIRSSIRGLTHAGKALKRSQDELHKNLDWVREVLHREEEE